MIMLNETIIDYKLIDEFDIHYLLKYQCIPVKKDDFYTYFYCENIHENLDEIFNCVCKIKYAKKREILFFLSNISIGLKLQNFFELVLKDEENQNSIIKFLQLILSFAHDKKSSDIHFESLEKSFVIRFRIDGVLKIFFQFETSLYRMISSLIKLKCNLDITQKRKPLNGRFREQINDKKVDFRVSTMPTIYGESIVLRLLDEQFDYQNLDSLGFNTVHYTHIKQAIQSSNGLILITGPTGSGKTTTLYSILHQLNQEKKKIITIEDPVEYQMANVQQVSINQEMGLGFNEVLKHVLRQDPDIIMIGEIRDKESLQIAFQASLTGHLVLSTLHTNDAVSTLNRLYDLDAKPYIVSSALKMIVSQRLILKKCKCQNGCELCNFSTYDGRVCISEVLNIDETVSSMIHKKEPLNKIMNHAIKNGFKTILEDGLEKVKNTVTTEKELYQLLGYGYEEI